MISSPDGKETEQDIRADYERKTIDLIYIN